MPFDAWYMNLGLAAVISALAHVLAGIRYLRNPSEFVKRYFRSWLDNTIIVFTSSYFAKHYVHPYLSAAVEHLFGPQ